MSLVSGVEIGGRAGAGMREMDSGWWLGPRAES